MDILKQLNDQHGMNEFNTKKQLWRSVMTHKISLKQQKNENLKGCELGCIHSYGQKLNNKVNRSNKLHNKIIEMEQKETDLL